MNQIREKMRTIPLLEAAGLLFLENLLIFVLALGLGTLLVRRFADRPVSPGPPPVNRMEVVLAITTLLLNTLVTVVGFWLWRAGIVRFRTDTGLHALLDVFVLVIVMDFAMYVLHRVAHIRWIYPIVHSTHHRYDHPRPLTLFVLNPAEALNFGGLWLLLICVYQSSWLGMTIYLTLNVLFGAVGHLGVEPLPNSWLKLPVLKQVSTSTFHAQHHQDAGHNFGFYTLIWDRLFGTLSTDYEEDFGHLPGYHLAA